MSNQAMEQESDNPPESVNSVSSGAVSGDNAAQIHESAPVVNQSIEPTADQSQQSSQSSSPSADQHTIQANNESSSQANIPAHQSSVTQQISPVHPAAPTTTIRDPPPAQAEWIGKYVCTNCTALLAYSSMTEPFACPVCLEEFVAANVPAEQRLPVEYTAPSMQDPGQQALLWSTQQLAVFLSSLNLVHLRPVFEAHFIDGKQFMSMDYQDFIEQLEIDLQDPRQFSKWNDLQTALTARQVLRGEKNPAKIVEIGHQMTQIRDAIYWQAQMTQMQQMQRMSQMQQQQQPQYPHHPHQMHPQIHQQQQQQQMMSMHGMHPSMVPQYSHIRPQQQQQQQQAVMNSYPVPRSQGPFQQVPSQMPAVRQYTKPIYTPQQFAQVPIVAPTATTIAITETFNPSFVPPPVVVSSSHASSPPSAQINSDAPAASINAAVGTQSSQQAAFPAQTTAMET